MRRFYLLLPALAAAPAIAGDTVNVGFELTAEAAACTPTLSNNGIADFGSRTHSSLSPDSFSQLGTREVTLTITCESSTALAITSRDTRASSVNIGQDANGRSGPYFSANGGLNVEYASRLFGLGVTAENKLIGSYAILINTAGVTARDGTRSVNVDMAGSESKSGGWSRPDYYLMPAAESYFYTFVRKGTLTPQPVSTVQVPLQISVAVADRLSSSRKVSLDGEAVISLVYL